MLVHKASMGVLEYIWTGQYRRDGTGTKVPVERLAKLADLPELDPADWWEIPGDTTLAKRLRIYYPDVEAIVSPSGELVDVKPLQTAKVPEDPVEQQERREEARRRGYRAPGRVRPKGLMPFLMGQNHTPSGVSPPHVERREKP